MAKLATKGGMLSSRFLFISLNNVYDVKQLFTMNHKTTKKFILKTQFGKSIFVSQKSFLNMTDWSNIYNSTTLGKTTFQFLLIRILSLFRIYGRTKNMIFILIIIYTYIVKTYKLIKNSIIQKLPVSNPRCSCARVLQLECIQFGWLGSFLYYNN